MQYDNQYAIFGATMADVVERGELIIHNQLFLNHFIFNFGLARIVRTT